VGLRLGRALRHRNYRLFFLGQGISLIGTWLTRFATLWMVYRLTGSGKLLGAVAFAGQAPSFLLSPVAGVLVDRWNRHKTIVVMQVLAALQSAALALFAFTGWMQVWHLMVLGAVQGVINAFDMPARQSFLGQMIEDRADLPNAIALNSSMVNGARLLGPVFAATLVGLFGEGWCFAIDAISYIAVIASLLMMTVPARPTRARGGQVFAEMRAGWRYVVGLPAVRTTMLLLAATSVLGGAYTTLLPMIAGDSLDGGPGAFGVLMAAAGFGALVGALYLASRETITGLPAVIGYATTSLGVGLVGLWWAPSTLVALPFAFACGLGFMVQMASTNTIIQTVVDSDKLGRVMSLYGAAFFGGMPIGALIQGTLADAIGPQRTLLGCGIAILSAATAYRFVMPHLGTAQPEVVDDIAEAS